MDRSGSIITLAVTLGGLVAFCVIAATLMALDPLVAVAALGLLLVAAWLGAPVALANLAVGTR